MRNKTFGDRVASMREGYGWTQKDFAKLTGLSVTFISELENNRREPGMSALASLGRTLGVSLDYLVFGPHS